MTSPPESPMHETRPQLGAQNPLFLLTPFSFAEAFGEATGTELVTKDHLKDEIEVAKNDLIKWIAGLLLAQAGLVTALVKLL